MTDPTGRAGAGAGAGGPRISRRTFLAAAGLAAVVPAAAAARADLSAAPGAPGAAVLAPLSIGYLAGSAGWASLDVRAWGPEEDGAAAGARLVLPARHLPGDGTLPGTPLRLTFHGLLPGIAGIGDVGIRSVALDVDVPAAGAPAGHRFHAWSARLGIAPGASGRTRITTVPDHDAPVALALALDGPDGPVAYRGLLGAAGAGVTRLRRGAYLLALLPGTWDRPRLAPPPGDPRWRAIPALLMTVDRA